MMSWVQTLASNGGRCGLSGCLGHCTGCGLRYHGSLCHGPSCGGCGRRATPRPAVMETLEAQDVTLMHPSERVESVCQWLAGAPHRHADETAWALALRAEHIARLLESEPHLRFLERGAALKSELITVSVILELVYDLPPPPERWGIVA